MNLAGKVLDILDEPKENRGRLLKEAAAGGVSIPAFVLNDSPPSAASEIPEDLFAYNDGVVKKYACDTKANTWVSGLYFLSNGHAFPEKHQQKIATTLVRFYFTHAIRPPDLLTKIAAGEATVPTREEREHSENFALAKTASEEPAYPIDTWEQLGQAETYFLKHASRFEPAQRREFCIKVAERVRALAVKDGLAQGIKPGPLSEAGLLSKVALAVLEDRDAATALDPLMQQYASSTFDLNGFKLAMHERLVYAHKKAPGSIVEDTYKTLYDNAGSLPVEKLASTLERIDRGSGFSTQWGHRFQDPYLSVLKIAGDPGDHVVFDEAGVRVTARDVHKLASSQAKIAQQWDPAFAKDFCTASDPIQVFQSLPRTDKLALARLIE